MRNEEDAYFREPEILDSLSRYEEARSKDMPVYMDADELTDIAEYYMSHNREEEANAAISLAIALHPLSVDPQVFLARQRLFYNDIEGAREICEAIVDKDDTEVHFLRAEIMIREQKAKKAMDYLEEVAASQDDERAWFLYESARVFCDYDLWDKALVWAERLHTEFPDNKDYPYLLSDILLGKGEYVHAIPVLEELLDIDPYDVESWNLLAEAQHSVCRWSDAIDSTDYVTAIEPGNTRALMTKASCLQMLGRLEESHDIYKSYLETNPTDAGILYLDCVCLTKLNRLEEARTAIDGAVKSCDEYDPDRMQYLMQQSHVLSLLHDVERATNALRKARDLMTQDDYFEYELLMGQIYLENDYIEEAQHYFERAVEVSDNRVNTLVLISLSLIDSCRYADAAAILENVYTYVVEAEEDVAPYLALCYYKLEENEKFLQYLKVAVRLNRATTEELFSSYFPGVLPEDYYHYAYRNIYGEYPVE